MQIDVEKLAKEAGFKERNGQIRVQHSNGSFVVVDEELSRFAALVLEAAAVQCEDESWEGRRHADAIRAMLSASPQAPQAAQPTGAVLNTEAQRAAAGGPTGAQS
jgi:hypothetical protein